jgi:hypothetical protein
MQIYKTTNLINGKIYIGQTIRSSEKYLGSGIKLKEAIKKYGKKNFKKEILLTVSTQQELDEAEIYFIKLFDSNNPKIGYNLNEGGQLENKTGTKLHKETKEKISKSLKGFKHSEETKKLMSKNSSGENNGMYKKGHLISGEKNGRFGGKGTTDETREKISKSKKGSKASEETKKLISEKLSGENNGMYGKNQYNIWLIKYGKEVADKKLQEFKEKQKLANKGKKFSEEHKEKIRQARIKYWQNKNS